MYLSNSYFKIIALVLFCLNISLMLILMKERKQYHKLIQSNNVEKSLITQLKNKQEILFLNISLMFEYQSQKIDNKIILIDKSNNKINLYNILNKKPKLVFKFSTQNCNSCVDEQLGLLKILSRKIDSSNIIILGDFESPRALAQFNSMNMLEIKSYILQNNYFTSIDRSLPYYFILNENFSLESLFIPIKGDTSLTYNYFDKVSSRYFHN